MKLRTFNMPVTIERLEAGDSNGMPSLQAHVVGSCWAQIETLSHLRLTPLEDSPFLTHRVTLRLRQPVTADCRVTCADARIFKVHQARSVDEDRDLQLLLCEEITP